MSPSDGAPVPSVCVSRVTAALCPDKPRAVTRGCASSAQENNMKLVAVLLLLLLLCPPSLADIPGKKTRVFPKILLQYRFSQERQTMWCHIHAAGYSNQLL